MNARNTWEQNNAVVGGNGTTAAAATTTTANKNKNNNTLLTESEHSQHVRKERERKKEARRKRRQQGTGRLSPSISPVRQQYDENNVRNLSEIIAVGQKYRGDLITKIECEKPIPLPNGQSKMKKMYTLENGIIMVETKIKDSSLLMEEYNNYSQTEFVIAENSLGNFLANSGGRGGTGTAAATTTTANRRGSMQSQGSAWDNASIQSRQSMEDEARIERERRKAARRGRRNARRTRSAPKRNVSNASTLSRSTRSDYSDGTLSSNQGSLDEFLTSTSSSSPLPPPSWTASTTTNGYNNNNNNAGATTQIETKTLSSDIAFIDIIIEPIGHVPSSNFRLSTDNETLDEGGTLCTIAIHTLYYHEDAIFRIETRSFANGRRTWGQLSHASIVGSTLKVHVEEKSTGTKDSVMYYLQDLATKSAHARQALMDG